MQTTHLLAILIWPDADSRHHAAVLMFENITMVYKITGDGEWDVLPPVFRLDVTIGMSTVTG